MKIRIFVIGIVMLFDSTEGWTQKVIAFGDCGASGYNLLWTLTSDSIYYRRKQSNG